MFEWYDPQLPVRRRAGAALPHWFQPKTTVFITFRTADSIPAAVTRHWRAKRDDWLSRRGIDPQTDRLPIALAALCESERREYHEMFSEAYHRALDRGLGACVLQQPELSERVANAIRHFDGARYQLGGFVVMPNHVHVLAGLLAEYDPETICQSWKRFSTREINTKLGTSGRFWQPESFDHLVRSPQQYAAILSYIEANPRHLPEGHYHLWLRR